jgi:hypothetical protein
MFVKRSNVELMTEPRSSTTAEIALRNQVMSACPAPEEVHLRRAAFHNPGLWNPEINQFTNRCVTQQTHEQAFAPH